MSALYIPLIEYVRDELVKQGLQSSIVDGGRRCMYCLSLKDGKTLKCAVGLLIPNGQYKASMEDMPAQDVVAKFPDAFNHVTKKFKVELNEELIKLFGQLQDIHDYHEPNQWEEKYNVLIVTYS